MVQMVECKRAWLITGLYPPTLALSVLSHCLAIAHDHCSSKHTQEDSGGSCCFLCRVFFFVVFSFRVVLLLLLWVFLWKYSFVKNHFEPQQMFAPGWRRRQVPLSVCSCLRVCVPAYLSMYVSNGLSVCLSMSVSICIYSYKGAIQGFYCSLG